MKKTLKTITFTATLALSLVASAGASLGRDHAPARETAWTDSGLADPVGVTWEAIGDRLEGVTWEE